MMEIIRFIAGALACSFIGLFLALAFIANNLEEMVYLLGGIVS